ncbi:DUF5683 domain-containing protein [Rhodocaloribacter sp.]
MRAFRTTALVLCMALAALPAHGQRTRAAVVEEIRQAYERLDYAEAEAKAHEALAANTDFTVDQLVEIHTLLALIAFSDNREAEARAQFMSALTLNPDLELDPLLVSPKILTFFDEIKRSRQRATSEQEPGAAIRYVRVEDPRAAAAMRSLLLPGWGQQYKGEKTKGWILTGLWGLAAAGTVAAHLRRKQTRDAYLAESNPDLVPARYDTFNTWHKARNNLALATALLWAYSYFDALLFRPAPPGDRRLLITADPSPTRPRLSLRLRF